MMKKIVFFILFLMCLLSVDYLFAQEKPFNLIKFGVKGFGGITYTCYLNSMSNEWMEKVVHESNAEFEGEPVSLPFNIEYGYQPFIIIQPIRFIQFGIKMDYAYSRLKGKFDNPLIKQNYELNIKTESCIPGIFANLLLGQFEFGGGIIYSYTSIDLNDDFFGYKDTWVGKNTGYELSFGFSSSTQNRFGYIMGIKYRNLIASDLKDNLNRKITYSNTQENLSLNMSGFVIEAGLYFQFIKMGIIK